ncbi:MFS transporter [uncultured Sphingomonas sp.]|uniref:MFS transporter n=1 Tax=uncultured Sphingomonas sp. TaxID=158754 RepID=UPI0035CAA860
MVASTVVGLMGTDLVLPAVPQLPEALGTTASSAQLVLAAYVGGTCVGLLVYGALSERVYTGRLFTGSLIATATVSLACGMARSTEELIALRAIQGAAAAAPAVFAPAIVKALFDETRAIRAMGLLGSIESLAPAIAPIVGAGLLLVGDWRLSFFVLAASAGALAVLLGVSGRLPQVGRRTRGGYAVLIRDAVFMRYALSQAFILGGLLTFVFGLPAVLVRVFGGTLTDFITIQVLAILTFVVAANLAGRAVARFGAERIIVVGTALCVVGAAGQFWYALCGGAEPFVILALFAPVNIGLGLRGPPGFYRAIMASRGDDARGSALVILGILGTTALGTLTASPFIELGTVPLSGITLALQTAALLCLVALPALPTSDLAQPSS